MFPLTYIGLSFDFTFQGFLKQSYIKKEIAQSITFKY